jgi:hypothetical protein
MPSSRRLPRSRRLSGIETPQRGDAPRYTRGRTRPAVQQDWQRELDSDFIAMKRVWQMLRHGAVRMIGEIGRQY